MGFNEQLIEAIAQKICTQANIYFRQHQQTTHIPEICKTIHGSQHACRTAIYIRILASFNRYYNNDFELDDDNIKLLQTAALCHDAGRLGEKEDLWEKDSAKILFHYLTENQVDEKIAIMLAEVIANKDFFEPGRPQEKQKYKKLSNTKDGLAWKEIDPNVYPIENIALIKKYIKLLHDADCLDILRARDGFEGERLHLHNDIAKNNKKAFSDLSMLICDIRNVIFNQGDAFRNQNIEIKKQYELAENCYLKTLEDIKTHPVLNLLYKGDNLNQNETLYTMPKYIPEEPLTDENLSKAIFSGNIFSRGIYLPAQNKKRAIENYFDFSYYPKTNPLNNMNLNYLLSEILNNASKYIYATTKITVNNQCFDCELFVSKHPEKKEVIFFNYPEENENKEILRQAIINNNQYEELTVTFAEKEKKNCENRPNKSFAIDEEKKLVTIYPDKDTDVSLYISLFENQPKYKEYKILVEEEIKDNSYQKDETYKILHKIANNKWRAYIKLQLNQEPPKNWKLSEDAISKRFSDYAKWFIDDAKRKIATKEDESAIALELRKTYRNTAEKKGNPVRSVSLIGPGATLFAPVGFLILSKSSMQIRSVNSTDASSGSGNKCHCKHLYKLLPQDEAGKELDELHYLSLLGGKTSKRYKKSTNEIIADLDSSSFDAIYFTTEPTFTTTSMDVNKSCNYDFGVEIQAIYIAQEYNKFAREQNLEKKELPIYRYSSYTHKFESYSIPTNDQLIEKWKQAVDTKWSIIKDDLKPTNNSSITEIADTVNKVKLDLISGSNRFRFFSPDLNYDADVRKAINDYIGDKIKNIQFN